MSIFSIVLYDYIFIESYKLSPLNYRAAINFAKIRLTNGCTLNLVKEDLGFVEAYGVTSILTREDVAIGNGKVH